VKRSFKDLRTVASYVRKLKFTVRYYSEICIQRGRYSKPVWAYLRSFTLFFYFQTKRFTIGAQVILLPSRLVLWSLCAQCGFSLRLMWLKPVDAFTFLSLREPDSPLACS